MKERILRFATVVYVSMIPRWWLRLRRRIKYGKALKNDCPVCKDLDER